MRRIFVLIRAMLRFRPVLLALLAIAVAADFAWHFYAGEPESAVRARDIRRAPALQAGDIVLCGRIGASGNVMRLAAKSPWTHAALAAGGDSASLLAPVKVSGSGSLQVRITRMAVRDFAQRCEAFGIARIGNCGEKCLAAARRARGMEETTSHPRGPRRGHHLFCRKCTKSLTASVRFFDFSTKFRKSNFENRRKFVTFFTNFLSFFKKKKKNGKSS